MKIRFMDGYETKYICREDFVSDEAWQRFSRYRLCKGLQADSQRKKKSRDQKKINNLQEVILNLNHKETESAAEFLKVF